MARHRAAKRRGRGRAARFFERLLALTALAGLGYGVYAFAEKSQEFRIVQMTIEGIWLVEEESVALASGVTQDDNLLLVRCGAVAHRIEALPAVKRCEVTRVFPDTLHVWIEERTPVATILSENHLYEIDRERVVVREISASTPHTGPYITGVRELGILEPGQLVDAPAVVEALALWDAFQKSAFGATVTVSELAAHSTNDIRMYCDELPFELRWGRGDYDRQTRRLDVLWTQQDKHIPCYEYLDLRFGQMLACR